MGHSLGCKQQALKKIKQRIMAIPIYDENELKYAEQDGEINILILADICP